MTNAEDLVIRIGMRPPDPTVNEWVLGDACPAPAASVVTAAVTSLVLADEVLEKFGGTDVTETRVNLHAYVRNLRVRPAGPAARGFATWD
jgi:hypothetical protein